MRLALEAIREAGETEGGWNWHYYISKGREQLYPLPVFAAARFIGPEDEIAAACSLLDRIDVRLLTMVGPPGIGKTRFSRTRSRGGGP